MASLAQILALLAMTVVSVAIEVVLLDMAKNSFNDQYLNCGDKMTKKVPEIQSSDFRKNSLFANAWRKAAQELGKNTASSPLTPDQAIALRAYTTSETNLYDAFSLAVPEGGSSRQKYRDEFHFKSLHFLLTRALQTLTHPNNCQDVFRGVRNKHFKVKQGDEVRFGQFTSTSLSKNVAQRFGEDTMFKVRTCHGADIHEFSRHQEQMEVLIPPFETFKATAVSTDNNNRMYIELSSIRNVSNYNCEWLKGGSFPRTSPNFWGLLLVTMAMAAVIRAL